MYMAAMYIMHEKHGVALDANRDILMSMPTITHLQFIYISDYDFYTCRPQKYVAKHVRPHLASSMQKDAVFATAHVYQKHSDCTNVQIGTNHDIHMIHVSWEQHEPHQTCRKLQPKNGGCFPCGLPGHVPKWLFLPRRVATMPRTPTPWCPIQLLFMDFNS